MIYSLSIYYSSTTGGRAEYITEDEKDPFDIVMQISSNSIILACVLYFFWGGGRGASSALFSFPLKGSKCFVVLSDGSYQPTP